MMRGLRKALAGVKRALGGSSKHSRGSSSSRPRYVDPDEPEDASMQEEEEEE
jgi:hypothetical protein